MSIVKHDLLAKFHSGNSLQANVQQRHVKNGCSHVTMPVPATLMKHVTTKYVLILRLK